MRCKCKNEMIAYNIALTGNFHKNAFYYCHRCGRLCVRFSEKEEKWLESQKSKEYNLLLENDIIAMLNNLKANENVSLRDKTKNEVIENIKKEIKNLKNFI